MSSFRKDEAYPYEYHRPTSPDDLDEEAPSGHTRVSSTTRLNPQSPEITVTRVSSPESSHLPQQSSSGSSRPFLITMDGPERWELQVGTKETVEPGSSRANTKRKAVPSDSISIKDEEMSSERPRSPGLDSLLEERPFATSSGSQSSAGFQRGHRPTTSDTSTVSGATLSPQLTSSKEKRKSFTSNLGERAFNIPIITRQSPGRGQTKLEPHEIIDQRAQMIAQWGIYWYLPSLMMAVFIAGIVGAIGHHAFYRSLHGRPSEHQLSMVRIGTAFAFFVKANLVGAVVLAYRCVIEAI